MQPERYKGDHELFIIVTATACLQKNNARVPSGTWDRVCPPNLGEFDATARRTRTYLSDKPLTSLPVIPYLGIKGHPTCLWCCFQSTILYLKFFF